MLREARGGEVRPESRRKLVRAVRGAARNSSGLGAERGRRVRGTREEARAVNRAQSRRVTVAESTRVDRRSNGCNGRE